MGKERTLLTLKNHIWTKICTPKSVLKCMLLLCLLGVFSMSKYTHSFHRKAAIIFDTYDATKFKRSDREAATPSKPFSFRKFESSLTQTYHMVCLRYSRSKRLCPFRHKEEGQGPYWDVGNGTKHRIPSRECPHPQKEIIIYQDRVEEPDKMSMRQHFGHFKVTFKPISRKPKQFYKVVTNQTAYFLGNRRALELMNFFHFTRQVYFPLYWMIKSSNQLNSKAQNIVFYPDTYAYCVNEKYIPLDINRYQYFRDILYIRNKDELSAFTDKLQPHRVCYKNAIFTSELFIDKAYHAIEYFKNNIGISDSYCNPEERVLTIINRKPYRRILNVQKLKEIGESLGYRTQVVYFEGKTLKEQAQVVHCTNILVGLVGAGLQWAFFMKNHSGVIEIAWPHKGWKFFFTGTGDYQALEKDVIRPLNFVQLGNTTCQLNPEAPHILLEDIFHTNHTIPYDEAMAILNDKRNYNFEKRPSHTVAKLCDIIVDEKAFRNAVIAAGLGVAK